MMAIDKEHVELLKKTIPIGFLQPIVRNKKNNRTLIGKHRELADPNWPSTDVYIEDPVTEELVILIGNVQRKPPREETQHHLLRLAQLLEAKGFKKERICAEIAKLPGMPYGQRYVEELFEDYPEYKMKTIPEKVEPVRVAEIMEEGVEKAKRVKKAIDRLNVQAASGDPYPYPECLCRNCPRRGECY